MPHEAAHLKTDMAQIRKMLDAWDIELIDATFMAAIDSGMSVEDVAFTSGYTESFIGTRMRIFRESRAMTFDIPWVMSEPKKKKVVNGNYRAVSLARPSKAHLITGQVVGIWLLDPVVAFRKRSPKRRLVRNPESRSVPSGIKFTVPPMRASHRTQASGHGLRPPGNPSWVKQP